MLKLVLAALLHTAATGIRLNKANSAGAAAAAEQSASGAGEPPAAAGLATEGGAGRGRSTCLKKYNNLCDPQSGNRAVLVTGSGGSGTHSLAAMFTMNGLDILHEKVGKGGSVSWAYSVDVTHTDFASDELLPLCLRWGWLKPPQPPETHFQNVYHVVRCPVDALGSMMAWPQIDDHCSMKYLAKTLELGWPYPLDYGDMRFWATAWLKQNEFVETYAQQTFTLDNFQDLFQRVCRDSGVAAETCVSATLPLGAGHRRHAKLTWANLAAQVGAELAGKVRSAAVRYGFGEDCLDDAVRAKERKLGGGRVTTHGIPGAECVGAPGLDCTDGLDWVWEASVVERINRSGGDSFSRAWATV